MTRSTTAGGVRRRIDVWADAQARAGILSTPDLVAAPVEEAAA